MTLQQRRSGTLTRMVRVSLAATLLAACSGDPYDPGSVTVGGSGPPVISQQPFNQTVAVGQSATFSVVANGATPLTYQWSRNDMPIGGATQATYTLPSASALDGGAIFAVEISNALGSVRSSGATLTVQ
jgi:hypothetical protein